MPAAPLQSSAPWVFPKQNEAPPILSKLNGIMKRKANRNAGACGLDVEGQSLQATRQMLVK